MTEEYIFNKVFKNHRFLQKLNESSVDGQLDKKYEKLMSLIDLLGQFKNIYFSKQSQTVSIIAFLNDNPTVYSTNDKSLDEIHNNIQEETKDLIVKSPFKAFDNDIRVIFAQGFVKSSSFILSYPAIRIQIALKNLSYGIGGISFVKSSGTKYGYGTFDKILSSEGMFSYNLNKIKSFIDDIYTTLEPQEDLITKLDTFDDRYRLKTYKENEITDTETVDIRKDGMVNIMKSDKSGLIPFIYTSQIITNSKPLPINSMSDLLIKNLEVMRTKCSSFDLYTATVKDSTSLSEGRIPLTQEEIDLKKQEDRNEVINYLTTMLKKKENRDYIFDTTNAMIDAYIDSIKKASNGIFNEDYTNSSNISSSLRIYQPEILAPYAVVFLEGSWDSLQGDDAKMILKKTFNINGKSIPADKCLIGYFDGMSEPLADAFVWIRASSKDEWRKLNISVKGGLNGKGAGASITSIKDFIFNYEGTEGIRKKYKDIYNWNLTRLGELLKERYPEEFEVFLILSSIPYRQLKSDPSQLLNALGNKVKSRKIKDIFEYINTNLKMASFIMDCLKSASFEFIQMNATPIESENGIHYNWRAQYPAVFVGDVHIEEPYDKKSGYTKFHIM